MLADLRDRREDVVYNTKSYTTVSQEHEEDNLGHRGSDEASTKPLLRWQ